MPSYRELLQRYLRQLGELGVGEVFFEELSADEARALVRTAGRTTTSAAGAFPDRARGDAPGRTGPTVSVPGRNDPVVQVPGRTDPAVHAPVRSAPVRPAPARDALRVLAQEVAGCTACPLHEGRQNVVFGEGNPAADLVIVGEAPGGEEDRTGRPFVGPAGKLLDLLLLTIGFPRSEVFICNILKCRPPGNRDPRPDEVEACTRFLHRQLELISPRAILAVGTFAAKELTASQESIGRLRGRVHDYRDIPLVATYHPAFLLRSRHRMRDAWQDFQLLRRVVDGR